MFAPCAVRRARGPTHGPHFAAKRSAFLFIQRRQMEASRRPHKRPSVSRSEMPRIVLCGKGGVCEQGPGKFYLPGANKCRRSAAAQPQVRFRTAKCRASFCAARAAFVSRAPANEIYRVRTRAAAVRRASRLSGFAQRNAAHHFARQGHRPQRFWLDHIQNSPAILTDSRAA